ncbi:Oligopeptide transport system permease protein OppB [Desulfosporosinus sp. BG]|nr:ABC transporter ATP-binding protein [Desulfosporosinus sp. BG]ODA43132.1 Oligopeptide transport system permease protein OppB [Desulfosporosinus sp. BG]
MEPVLQLKNLSVSFDTPKGEVEAVRDVSLSLNKGEILALVGESGCGKTVMSQSVLKLLPKSSRIKQGRIIVEGEDITDYKEKQMRKLRGGILSMVFQDPMTTLNPTIPIGKQITESILKHNKAHREQARKRALEMLALVGIENPEQMFALQPHFFSGGMRQRCVLAIALASNPKVLFADEATTALDVTVQAKIIDLLLDIRDKTGISIIFISHDLGAVARIADRVAVMYAGKIVEIGTAEEVYYDPRHPYLWGLMSSLPSMTKAGENLTSIPGMPPVMLSPPPGDAFAVRNEFALAIDYEEMPPMFQINPTHSAATWLLDDRAPKITPPISLGSRTEAWKQRKF